MDEIIGTDPALDAAGSAAGGVTRRRLIYAAPALAAVGLAALFASRLGVDPSQIPSNLIGKRVPVFSLPPVRTLGLSSDLHGEVSLINVRITVRRLPRRTSAASGGNVNGPLFSCTAACGILRS